MSEDLASLLPPDLFYACEQDMWVRFEPDGSATIGTTHVVAAHGEFMIFTPRPDGTQVKRDHSLGVMETAKTAVAIHAPLSLRILAANAEVIDDVALIERDPYGAGWMFRVAPTAVTQERATLLDARAYAEWLAPRLAQKLADRPGRE